MKSSMLLTAAFGLTILMQNPALAAGDGHGGGGLPHRDNNALYPQPQADITKATPPPQAKLTEPKFQAKTETAVTLRWEAATGADHYHVQVATDPNFKWLVTENHNVSGTSFEAKDLKPGTKYFWRVAGWKSDNMAATNKAAFAISTFETR